VGSDCTSSNGALLHAAPSRRRGRLAVICRRSVKVWRVVPTVLGVFCPLMIAERLPADPPSIFGITRRTSPSCHHTSGFLLPCTCLSVTGCPPLFALARLFSLWSARVPANPIRLDAIHWHGYVFIPQCIPHRLLQLTVVHCRKTFITISISLFKEGLSISFSSLNREQFRTANTAH
jgi:hypothetical protein